MIEKERLEELIEQKKSIYWKFAKIKPSSWSKHTIMGNMIVKGNLKEMYSLNDLFETKEDFEWYREFGCIERTERLELPTWEEFISNTNGVEFYRINGDKIRFHKVAGDKVFTMYDKNGKIHFEREWFLTKENYTLACRKAKELFLGE